MTLDELITRLTNFPDKVGKIAEETMKAEAPSPGGGTHVGDRDYSTGNLRDSIHYTHPDMNTVIVGTEVEYANIVVSGRKEVHPVHAPYLRWYDPVWGGKDGYVRAKKSKKVRPNPFDKETVKKLNSMMFEL